MAFKTNRSFNLSQVFGVLLILALLLPTLFLLGGCGDAEQVAVKKDTYKVVKIIDGDTITVRYKGKDEKVRFIGVDTPEIHPKGKGQSDPQPFALEARDFTREKLEGRRVRLEFDVAQRDKYRRLLAYVYLGDEMINRELLKAGLARVATFPPNVKYVETFRRDQAEARENKVGMWGD